MISVGLLLSYLLSNIVFITNFLSNAYYFCCYLQLFFYDLDDNRQGPPAVASEIRQSSHPTLPPQQACACLGSFALTMANYNFLFIILTTVVCHTCLVARASLTIFCCLPSPRNLCSHYGISTELQACDAINLEHRTLEQKV